jgi:hypothetical protein
MGGGAIGSSASSSVEAFARQSAHCRRGPLNDLGRLTCLSNVIAGGSSSFARVGPLPLRIGAGAVAQIAGGAGSIVAVVAGGGIGGGRLDGIVGGSGRVDGRALALAGLGGAR